MLGQRVMDLIRILRDVACSIPLTFRAFNNIVLTALIRAFIKSRPIMKHVIKEGRTRFFVYNVYILNQSAVNNILFKWLIIRSIVYILYTTMITLH